jgi:ABC-type lipoprotein export system ATPase subunit
MNKTPSLISAQDVCKAYDRGKIPVLREASLEVEEGAIVALWGASGSGKSTLLHLLGGLDTPDRGELRVAGLNPADERHRLALRREKVGFVFQLHNLIPDLTVRENCLLTMIPTKGDRKVFSQRFESLSERIGIAHRRERRIQELSGGERQRVAICRALMHAPRVLLADEPTGSLDEKTGSTVFALLQQLARETDVTVVMATHERRFAEACDHIFHVRDGEVTAL